MRLCCGSWAKAELPYGSQAVRLIGVICILQTVRLSLRQILIYGWWILAIVPLFSVSMALTGSMEIDVPLEPIIGLQVLGLIGYYLSNRPKITWRKLDTALLVFSLAAVVSVALAHNQIHAGKAWVVMLAYIAAFYGSYRILNPSQVENTRAWNIYSIGFAVLAVFALINVARLGIGYEASYQIAEPFSAGHTLLIASGMPAFLYVFDRACREGFRWYRLAFLLLVIVLIGVSYSRMYWPVLPVILLLYAIKYVPRHRKALSVLTIVLVVGGIIGIIALKAYRDRTHAWEDPNDHKTLSAQITSLINFRANDSNLDRLNRWKIAWVMFEDHPITGTGMRNYQVLFPEYPTQVTFYSDYQVGLVANAHSFYLGILAEMGIIGAIAMLLFLFVAFQTVWRNRRHAEAFLALMLLINFIALGLIEDFLLLETIAPYWWLSLGFVATMLPRSEA